MLEERARDCLAQLHLLSDAERMVSELPYGKQRQMELARALVGGADVLLDEPAAGLNTGSSASWPIFCAGSVSAA